MNKQKDKALLAIKKQAESPFIKKRNTLINKDFLKKMGKPLMKDTVATVKRLPPGQTTTILGVKYQKSLDGRRLTVYKPLDKRIVKINGIEFKLSPTGIKLVRKVTETNKAEITPKIVQYKNELYYRTKSGNLTKNITKSLLMNNKLVNSEKSTTSLIIFLQASFASIKGFPAIEPLQSISKSIAIGFLRLSFFGAIKLRSTFTVLVLPVAKSVAVTVSCSLESKSNVTSIWGTPAFAF